MGARWISLENFYETDGDTHIFYPWPYARGYPFSNEDRARMDSILGPFLTRRLWMEFVALFGLVSFSLMGGLTMFLFKSTAEELDALLAKPPGIWLFVALVLACVILLPVLVRLWLKIKLQLHEMDVYPSEPPRPDFFIVEGEFSLTRLACVLFAASTLLLVVGMWMY